MCYAKLTCCRNRNCVCNLLKFQALIKQNQENLAWTKGPSIKDIRFFWPILDLLTYLYPIFGAQFQTYLQIYMSSYPILANLLTNWNVGYPLWTAPKYKNFCNEILIYEQYIFFSGCPCISTPSFGQGNTHLSTSGENAQGLLLSNFRV